MRSYLCAYSDEADDMMTSDFQRSLGMMQRSTFPETLNRKFTKNSKCQKIKNEHTRLILGRRGMQICNQISDQMFP